MEGGVEGGVDGRMEGGLDGGMKCGAKSRMEGEMKEWIEIVFGSRMGGRAKYGEDKFLEEYSTDWG